MRRVKGQKHNFEAGRCQGSAPDASPTPITAQLGRKQWNGAASYTRRSSPTAGIQGRDNPQVPSFGEMAIFSVCRVVFVVSQTCASAETSRSCLNITVEREEDGSDAGRKESWMHMVGRFNLGSFRCDP
ncbi:hypothetical protein MTP99_011104 [Tenebrio molitor]|nr:hypothetical protein MTP99_011104 [Tenebrio molitor]